MKSLLLGILFLIVALVIAGAVALGAVNLGVDRTATKTHVVFGKLREIVVKPGAGGVEFVPGATLVRVRETQHYVVYEPKLVQTRRHGVLRISTHCKDTLGGIVPCYSDMRITVPAGMRISVHAGSGDVNLRGVDVRAAHAESGSGNLTFGLVGRPGLLWAHAASGDVELVAGSARAVDARSDSGDIDVDVAAKPRRVLARSDSGDIQLTLPRGIYRVRTKADSGHVRVRGILRNAGSPSSIDARTTSGDIALRPR